MKNPITLSTTTLFHGAKSVVVPTYLVPAVHAAWGHLQICQHHEYACESAEEAVAFLRACHHRAKAARFAAALAF